MKAMHYSLPQAPCLLLFAAGSRPVSRLSDLTRSVQRQRMGRPDGVQRNLADSRFVRLEARNHAKIISPRDPALYSRSHSFGPCQIVWLHQIDSNSITADRALQSGPVLPRTRDLPQIRAYPFRGPSTIPGTFFALMYQIVECASTRGLQDNSFHMVFHFKSLLGTLGNSPGCLNLSRFRLATSASLFFCSRICQKFFCSSKILGPSTFVFSGSFLPSNSLILSVFRNCELAIIQVTRTNVEVIILIWPDDDRDSLAGIPFGQRLLRAIPLCRRRIHYERYKWSRGAGAGQVHLLSLPYLAGLAAGVRKSSSGRVTRLCSPVQSLNLQYLFYSSVIRPTFVRPARSYRHLHHGKTTFPAALGRSLHRDPGPHYDSDIRGSIAYARANTKNGILTQQEFAEIERGFGIVLKEWEEGRFEIKPGVDEDIHTANERRLGEVIGKDIAGKLHTGRSRNDQVATDMRLWLRDQLDTLEGYLVDLLKVIAARAEKDIEAVMPGYTHLQRAQPIRWSHWMLMYASFFTSDLARIRELKTRVNKCPLGCGALAGNPFNVDRDAIAKELGFDGLIMNSLAGVGDRDFVVETLQWGSTLMMHMSRWAEDLIIYSSGEFSFVKLADAYSTGSSLMPQKKNPDSLELLRGKSGRVFGQMAGLMMSVKGIPSTYNKDLQESVEPLLDHVKTVGDSLQIATGVLSTLAIQPENMLKSLTPDMLATDLADYLVRKGVPFRETHHISGQVVALAEKENKPMDQLSFQQLQSVDQRFEQNVMEVFDYQKSVEMRSAKGGTSRSAVMEQIEAVKKALAEDQVCSVLQCSGRPQVTATAASAGWSME
ncbi:putative argininosuccinate [Hortaea werneckii]|nr:putative argininosuccinate [Hortaea werneckii]